MFNRSYLCGEDTFLRLCSSNWCRIVARLLSSILIFQGNVYTKSRLISGPAGATSLAQQLARNWKTIEAGTTACNRSSSSP